MPIFVEIVVQVGRKRAGQVEESGRSRGKDRAVQ